MKTFVPKENKIQKKWYLIDADGKVLGKVAAEAARLLRGKHKPYFTPFMDCGDNVIIINAEKAVLTGNKVEEKKYYRHSGYKGGLKEITYKQMIAKHPTRAMELAVVGMLPHNRLGRKIARHLKVYADDKHNNQAQNPVIWEMKD
ncbi:MAG TPA: 50S ribosomal protein L13 [Candidatus Hydrogenedens sp.]|nr:50S ribosomal protein L13 [Candidatus Hydrogenedens sp.]